MSRKRYAAAEELVEAFLGLDWPNMLEGVAHCWKVGHEAGRCDHENGNPALWCLQVQELLDAAEAGGLTPFQMIPLDEMFPPPARVHGSGWCVQCGHALPEGSRRDRRTCSDQCRQAHRRRHMRPLPVTDRQS